MKNPALQIEKRRLKVIDLYCGAGGLSLGAARAGMDVVAGVELDTQALATHAANFPAARHLPLDVASINGDDLLAQAGLAVGELDALIGGPPCQGFSVMGRRDPHDERNTLFGHFMRLVAQTQPAFFVAENVPGIGHVKNGFVLSAALAHVPEYYQVLPPVMVQGHHYGAPTSRKRLFFIGVDTRRLPPIHAEAFLPTGNMVPVSVQDALCGLSPIVPLPDPKQVEDMVWSVVGALPDTPFYARVRGCIPPGVGHANALARYLTRRELNGHIGVVHAPEIAARYGALSPGQKDPVSRSVRLKLDGFCPTLRAGTGSEKGRRQAVRPIHPIHARVITPREAARLQGFPDWFLLPSTKWHSFRQIGNSVSPLVAEMVLSVLVQHMQTHASVKQPAASFEVEAA